MENEFDKLKKIIEDLDKSGDINKFYNKKNDTAAIRIREIMQLIKEKAQNVRDEISGIRKVRRIEKEPERQARRAAKLQNNNLKNK